MAAMGGRSLSTLKFDNDFNGSARNGGRIIKIKLLVNDRRRMFTGHSSLFTAENRPRSSVLTTPQGSPGFPTFGPEKRFLYYYVPLHNPEPR